MAKNCWSRWSYYLAFGALATVTVGIMEAVAFSTDFDIYNKITGVGYTTLDDGNGTMTTVADDMFECASDPKCGGAHAGLDLAFVGAILLTVYLVRSCYSRWCTNDYEEEMDELLAPANDKAAARGKVYDATLDAELGRTKQKYGSLYRHVSKDFAEGHAATVAHNRAITTAARHQAGGDESEGFLSRVKSWFSA